MEMAAQASLRKVNTQFGKGLLEAQPFLGSCYLRDLTLCIKQFSGLDQSCCFFLFFLFLFFKKKWFAGQLYLSLQFTLGLSHRRYCREGGISTARSREPAAAFPGRSASAAQALCGRAWPRRRRRAAVPLPPPVPSSAGSGSSAAAPAQWLQRSASSAAALHGA